MPRINIRDILKKGAKLEVKKISKKEWDEFTLDYNKANEDYLKSVETRNKIDWKSYLKPMEI